MAKPLSILIADEQLEVLRHKAQRLGMSVEELVRQPDDALERAAKHVLAKNAELYERLG